MPERGMQVTHTTIVRWVHQYSPIIDERIRKHLKAMNDPWRIGEAYLKIKGKNAYLFRAVDSKGKTIDFYVLKHRDKHAARKFLRNLLWQSKLQDTTSDDKVSQ